MSDHTLERAAHIAGDLVIFLAALIVTNIECVPKEVTCGGQGRTQQAAVTTPKR